MSSLVLGQYVTIRDKNKHSGEPLVTSGKTGVVADFVEDKVVVLFNDGSKYNYNCSSLIGKQVYCEIVTKFNRICLITRNNRLIDTETLTFIGEV